MLARLAAVALILAVLLLAAGAHARRQDGGSGAVAVRPLAGWTQDGAASWYGPGFIGRPTASGMRFDTLAPMAAHRSLPFGSLVRVTRRDTGVSTYVVIRDRGPFKPGRVIDLSLHSARQLGMERSGVAPVRLEVMR